MSLWILYSLALALALVVASPWWLYRMATAGKYRAGLAGRLGFVPPALRAAARGRRTIWLHAVSVGEIIAATRLIAALEHALPDHLICISTTTRTGHTLAMQRFGTHRVFYIPLDFAFLVRRYLRALNPEMLLLMETELWPNLLLQCSRLGIPIAVANARISDRSYPRYQRLRALWSPLLRRVSLFAAQSSLDAARLRELGANNVAVFGNLKFDVRTDPASSALVSQLRTALPANAPILICGSTLAGEEDDLLDCLPALHAVAPGLICILAPRHPERFAAVADLLTHRGLSFTRRSQWNGASIAPASIFLLDSVGDLAALYSIATVAFVGGSLFTGGGHNPLEPAQFAIPIVIGDSFENFRDIIRAMLASQALIVTPRKHLCANLTALLSDSSRAAALGLAAQRVYLAEAGATARTVAALLPMLAQKGSEQ